MSIKSDKDIIFKIPKDATNGDVIMMLFPDTIVRERVDGYDGFDLEILVSKKPWLEVFKVWYPSKWWNAQYRK